MSTQNDETVKNYPLNILMAEDSHSSRVLLEEMLISMGHQVTSVENGEQAVNTFKTKGDKLNLILLDVEMPIMDGHEATQRLRELMQDKWIPIVILSARNLDEDITQGIDIGADDYLIKPVNKNVLEKKLLAMARIARMQDEIVAVNQALEEKNHTLKNFAFLLTHDIKQPLRTIQSFADLLIKNISSNVDEKAQSYIHRIRQSITRLNDLTESLLNYTKVSNMSAHPTNLSLEKLVADIEQDLEILIKEKQVTLETKQLPILYGDKQLIRQLFFNLILNAIKYQNPDIKPHIELFAESNDDMDEIHVKDNGIGIAEEYHERIFGFLKRLHTANQYDGHGIGLSLCQKIIEMHKGCIQVISEEGKGADFIVRLPKSSAS